MKIPVQKAIEEKFEKITSLLEALKNNNKLEYLNGLAEVNDFIEDNPIITKFLDEANNEEIIVIKSIIALGQGKVVFGEIDQIDHPIEWIHLIAQLLIPVEKFYGPLNGLIGYHHQFLKLLLNKTDQNAPNEVIEYLKPEGLHITQEDKLTLEAVRWGLDAMPHMVEIYPVGGAGERLGLQSMDTHEDLPVAKLILGGYSLIEWLIRDIQAREYLYYKLFGKNLLTPIAMMTSFEKNNHFHILNLCEESDWWGRPRSMFRLFIQPLVPVISEEGYWLMDSATEIKVKPGGHGVIWKLANDQKVFDWTSELRRDVALVRQINNPIAGTDYGLLALMGIGWHEKKALGFASCPRVLKTAQGMNVLVEKKLNQGFEYTITNIEYTEFEQRGIKDEPETPKSSFSKFPANTNILFVSINEIKKAISLCPFPGLMINMKSKAQQRDPETGALKEVKTGRLETMMQNIADVLVDKKSQQIAGEDTAELKTFVIYNDRRKTISVAKRAYDITKPLLETPEGCFYEMMQNARDLLVKECGIEVPEIGSEDEYLESGPAVYISYHPALGPIYGIIRQKIRGGSISEGSSLQLEIAELDLQDLKLDGALNIIAKAPLGKKNVDGVIVYGDESGKCELINISIKNDGINRQLSKHIWREKPIHQEAVTIVLHGNAEFAAKDVTFLGDHHIEVEDGQRMTAHMAPDGSIEYHVEKITKHTWKWNYTYGTDYRITLKRS